MRRSLLALTVLLAVPATAGAATVTVSGDPPALQIQAAPGEVNAVDVHDVFVPVFGLGVSDAGAPLGNDGSCADASPLLCPALPVVARLGDRGDRASVVNTSDDATVYGEDGNDDILSSGFAGFAYGGAGDDRVRVNSNSQASGYGGTGDDTIRAGSVANAAAFGESGNDVLIHEPSVQALLDGGAGRDVLIGLPNGFGPLEAHGGAGTDILAIQSTGGSGRVARWALFGDAGNDLIAGGPGADTIDGGTGGDAIYSAGGGADTVTCGSGFDVVRADADDTVAADCELRYVAPAASIPSPITSALRAARR